MEEEREEGRDGRKQSNKALDKWIKGLSLGQFG